MKLINVIYFPVLIFVFIAYSCTGQDGTGMVFKTIDVEVAIAAENFSSKGGTVGSWYVAKTQSGYLDSFYMQSSDDKPADGSHLKVCRYFFVFPITFQSVP